MARNERVSRRRFLGQAASTSAAMAAPTLIPRYVLSAPGRPGSNDTIGVARIGNGRQGSGLGKDSRARLVAFADVKYKTAGDRYQDYRKLLERKDVDAVTVGTPDHWHVLCSIHACQAGKDVYCEKPMSLTIHEGRQLVKAVRKYKRVFQTGSQQRSMTPNRVACEFIRGGGLGKIKQVLAANYPSPWTCKFPEQPVPADLDWDMWCGPTEPVPYHKDVCSPRTKPGWISMRTYSGGEMTGWGSHGLDQIQWALGMDESGPIEIWTEGEPFKEPVFTAPHSRGDGEKACRNPIVYMKYAGDIVMKFDGGNVGGGTFIGEKGTIHISRGKFKCDPPDLLKIPKGAARAGHTADWINCIKSRERCVADVEIGHRSATVCHLANIARWVGRKLKWDPVKERFDDDEANKHLDRPRRKPWVLPDPV